MQFSFLGLLQLWEFFLDGSRLMNASTKLAVGISVPSGSARIYLGKAARESGWFCGLLMLTAGGFTALIVFLVHLF